MKKIAIIGGTGLYALDGLQYVKTKILSTKYGSPSSDVNVVFNGQTELYFLPRHGVKHQIAPHLINYRANISALKSLGITDIIAVNAVGGIDSPCSPSRIVIPDQLIDYTYARAHTFNENNQAVSYVDFSDPYSQTLRKQIISLFKLNRINSHNQGTYAATQGPRLETQAEIQKLKNDGCTIVGMTGMPEAILAKELDINYVSCCIVVNWASGIKNETINMVDIKHNLNIGMKKINTLINSLSQNVIG